jgi:hypothetical protein
MGLCPGAIVIHFAVSIRNAQPEKMRLLSGSKCDRQERRPFEKVHRSVFNKVIGASKFLISLVAGICFFAPTFAYAECVPNKTLSSDKRFLDLRWAIGSRSNIVKLRVPIEYNDGNITGCLGPSSLFAKSDDNVDTHAHSLALRLPLPDFPQPSDSNAWIIGPGLGQPTLDILVTSITSAIIDKAEMEQSMFDTSVSIFLGDRKLKEYNFIKGVKADKYGLKRIGAIGDFEPYKNKLPAPPADDFFYSDDHPVSVWAQCKVEEIKDQNEEPGWRGHWSCELNFRNERLDATVQIHMLRMYMHRWREVKSRVEQLIDSFEIQKLN